MQLVLIKHHEDGNPYLFSTPFIIRKGDRVRCETRFGEMDGIAITDSAWFDDEELETVKVFISDREIKPVVGLYKYHPFEVEDELKGTESVQDRE